jgi:GTPase involved in cell partitioning and DNA repair
MKYITTRKIDNELYVPMEDVKVLQTELLALQKELENCEKLRKVYLRTAKILLEEQEEEGAASIDKVQRCKKCKSIVIESVDKDDFKWDYKKAKVVEGRTIIKKKDTK